MNSEQQQPKKVISVTYHGNSYSNNYYYQLFHNVALYGLSLAWVKTTMNGLKYKELSPVKQRKTMLLTGVITYLFVGYRINRELEYIQVKKEE